MTLSVGFGKIFNDPEATIITRKALGRLSTPGLLVEDKGLTINNDGRMVLRIANSSGLSEDSNGLALKLAPGGGLFSTSDGLAIDADTFGDITVDSIHVLGNANIDGNVNVTGIVSSSSANIVGAVNSGSISTGVVSSTSVSTGVVSSTSVSTGALIATSAAISGALSAASATISGAVSAASAAISGAITAASATISGALNSGSAAISGNATVGGNLTVTGTITGSGGTGAITPSSVTINGGSTIIRCVSAIVAIYVNPPGEGSDDDIVYVPGARYGDVAMCSPLTLPSVAFLSWSAMVLDSDTVIIRTSRGLTPGADTYYFRVVVIGFS